MNSVYEYEPIIDYQSVASGWYEKIAPTAFASFSAKGLHHQLTQLARQATSLLLTETYSIQEARDIGAALAGLNYVQGDALGASIEVLTATWLESIPADRIKSLQPRLSALLGAIANGYFDRATVIILKDEASIRHSYVSSLQTLHDDLKRQRNKLRLSADRLQTLHEIESGILAAESARSIADIALEHLVRIIPCLSAAVSLFDLPRAQSILLAGYKTSRALDSIISITDWKAIDTLKRHEPLIINDLAAISQPTPGDIAAIEYGKRSLLSVPLLTRGELIGAMTLTAGQPGAFGAQDVETAQQIGDSVAVALHNAQLLETEQNARREAETLREIAANMNTSLDRDELLDLILTQLLRVLPYDSASILLNHTDSLVVAAHQGIELHTEEIFADLEQLPPNITRLLHEQQPLIIPDTQDNPDWIVYPGGDFIRCWLGVPLIAKEGLIGLLMLDNEQPNIYAQQEAVMAMAFANHAAVAIENARLYRESQRYAERMEQQVEARIRDLTALYDITAVSSQFLDLQTSLKRIMSRISAALDSTIITIHILDETATKLRLSGYQGLSPPMVDFMQELPIDYQFIEKILKGEEPFILSEPQSDPGLSDAPIQVPFTYSVGAPIRSKGKVLGVLGIATAHPQPPTREDIALLTSIADQIGVTFENAQLRQRAEQSAVIEERERLARDLHDSATQSLFSLTLFAAAARELVRNGQLEQAQEYLDDIGSTANQTHKEMRLLLYELRPSILAEEGLVGALNQRMQAVEDRSGIQSHITAEIPTDLPASVEEALHQVANEALNNILRHADADSVSITIRMKSSLIILKIIDNGQGFQTDSAEGGAGMGLSNMRQRIEALNGSLEYNSVPGKGSQVIARVPVDI
ncbi:MAG: GAF domain-containing protein [Chloroflexi bacterium]|jgi:signal transduction histidine kinase|nr:GAF domain-containing protein [Chloroflexota bacterium]